MRTTLELPDELMRAIKVRAAQSDHTLTEEISSILRAGLVGAESAGVDSPHVQLPLVRTARAASAAAFAPERIADLLTAGDVDDLAS